MSECKRMKLMGFLSLILGLIAGVVAFGTPSNSPETTYQPWALWQVGVVASLLWVLVSMVTKLKLMFTGDYGKLGRITGIGSCLLLVLSCVVVIPVERVGPAPVFHPAESILMPIWLLVWWLIDILSVFSE